MEKQGMQNTVTLWKDIHTHIHLLLLLRILSQRYTGENITRYLHKAIHFSAVIGKAGNNPNIHQQGTD